MLNEPVSSIVFVKSYPTWLLNLSTGGLATIFLVMFFILLVMFESYHPRENHPKNQLRLSYQANLKLFVFNSAVMSLMSIPALFVLAEQYSAIGLLRNAHEIS